MHLPPPPLLSVEEAGLLSEPGRERGKKKPATSTHLLDIEVSDEANLHKGRCEVGVDRFRRLLQGDTLRSKQDKKRRQTK